MVEDLVLTTKLLLVALRTFPHVVSLQIESFS